MYYDEGHAETGRTRKSVHRSESGSDTHLQRACSGEFDL
jgi:hypothetical protein